MLERIRRDYQIRDGVSDDNGSTVLVDEGNRTACNQDTRSCRPLAGLRSCRAGKGICWAPFLLYLRDASVGAAYTGSEQARELVPIQAELLIAGAPLPIAWDKDAHQGRISSVECLFLYTSRPPLPQRD